MARPGTGSNRETNQVFAVGLLIVLIVILTSTRNARESADNALLQRAADTLSAYSGNLSSELDKYRSIPLLLALHPVLAQALSNPENASALQAANELLEKFNTLSSALDTYILNTRGITLAASNWNTPHSFIGEDLRFRPYFQDAVNHGNGYYFALGNTSLKRGYYFSAAIYSQETVANGLQHSDKDVVGVLTVKISMDELEQAWSQVHDKVAVSDKDGVIFIASEPHWVYRSLDPIPDDRKQQIIQSRRYANNPLTPLDIESRKTTGEQTRLLEFGAETHNAGKTLLQYSQQVPEKGWVLHIFLDYSVVPKRTKEAAIGSGSVAALALVVLGLISVKAQARAREEKIKLDAYDAMEEQVRTRTRELSAAQDNLVQTAKMAALGQMATSITHELSQPLSAIRAFADNALEYLNREEPQSARSNLNLIVGMSERMTVIMQNLKTFARKTSFKLESVSVHNVIRETLALMQPAIQQAGVNVRYVPMAAAITVRAEPVRLQQVFTNLLQNAIDAVSQTEKKNISISSEINGSQILVSISDSGVGIADELRGRLYEPFSSNKKTGEGLGLGLSLSYGIIREFGGTISESESPDQGTVFTVKLEIESTNSGASC